MNHARKNFEKKQLEHFLRVTELAKKVKRILPHERPDFVLEFEDGRRIAVEHTQPRDETRAAHDALLPSLTREICKGLDEQGQSLWIHLTLSLPSAQTLLAVPGQGAQIAECLLALIAGDRERVQASWAEYSSTILQQSPLLAALEEVHVVESRVATATWGSKNLDERLAVLQDSIVSKTAKLLDYQSNVEADEFWLLVVSGPGLGCIPSLLQSRLPHPAGYQRIYLMDEFGQDCFALNGETSPLA